MIPLRWLLLIPIVFYSLRTHGDTPLGVFDSYWENTAASFTGVNAAYHLGAAAGTFAIIETGWDAHVQRVFWKDPLGSPGALKR